MSGHIYGVILNDRDEIARLAPQFDASPYLAPPQAPVVYMKPRASIATDGIVRRRQELVCAPTLALLFARDAAKCAAEQAIDHVGAAALAVDFSCPEASYYRPAVAQRNGDGFLALGTWSEPRFATRITTFLDNDLAHRWDLDRLLRSPAQLIAALTDFMTLRAGDILLVGLPGDAPRTSTAQRMRVEATGFASLSIGFAEGSR